MVCQEACMWHMHDGGTVSHSADLGKPANATVQDDGSWACPSKCM